MTHPRDNDPADLPGDDPRFVEDDETVFEVRTFDMGRRAAAPTPAAPPRRTLRIEPRAPSAPALSVALRPSGPRRAAGRHAPRPPGLGIATLRTVLLVLAAAILVSTIFSLWTRPTFFSGEFRAGLNEVQATQRVFSIQPSPLPTDSHQVRIGVIAGHSGPPQDTAFEKDPGAVCDDGLTELEINEAVAREVVTLLSRDLYTVELLQEFDPRLEGYQADVLVSIHSNDCQDYGAAGTGFAAASASGRRSTRGQDDLLLTCLIAQYAEASGLPQHQGLTFDMTAYHTFSEVAVDTPTAIIELGFLRNNRDVLTGRQGDLALGVANGIRCFLNPDSYQH